MRCCGRFIKTVLAEISASRLTVGVGFVWTIIGPIKHSPRPPRSTLAQRICRIALRHSLVRSLVFRCDPSRLLKTSPVSTFISFQHLSLQRGWYNALRWRRNRTVRTKRTFWVHPRFEISLGCRGLSHGSHRPASDFETVIFCGEVDKSLVVSHILV